MQGQKIFMELWFSFQIRYQTYHEELKYLDDTWTSPNKEKFVTTWTNNVTHFRHAVTSHGESSQRRLKTYMGTSMLDLLQCCKRIKVSIEGFLTDYLAKRASDQMQTPLFVPFPEDGYLSERHKKCFKFLLSKVNEKTSQRCDEVGKL